MELALVAAKWLYLETCRSQMNLVVWGKVVPRHGIEPRTRGFSERKTQKL